MPPTLLRCPYCGRANFKSASGLSQHQERSAWCLKQAKLHLGVGYGERQAKSCLETSVLHCPEVNVETAFFNDMPSKFDNQQRQLTNKWFAAANQTVQKQINEGSLSQQSVCSDESSVEFPSANVDDSDVSGNMQTMAWQDGSDDSQISAISGVAPDETMLEECKAFAKEAKSFPPYTNKMVNAIKLMAKLRQTKASMGAHEPMHQMAL